MSCDWLSWSVTSYVVIHVSLGISYFRLNWEYVRPTIACLLKCPAFLNVFLSNLKFLYGFSAFLNYILDILSFLKYLKTFPVSLAGTCQYKVILLSLIKSVIFSTRVYSLLLWGLLYCFPSFIDPKIFLNIFFSGTSSSSIIIFLFRVRH